mmetsp:Transcript_41099/g.86347  ORF Transcript_41099/g.86347 Transcript_41099/m.86347 type:complete len:268 (-) Transcript_41099:587-1390(-)
MFDVTWGEIVVVAGVGLVLIGRRDLPIASRAFGHQIGRIVGLTRGARLRADRFASDHQLKQLQNEFRSGLRELDAVKAELAGSMMAGQDGRNGNLGALVSGVDRKKIGTGKMPPENMATNTPAPAPTSPALTASSMGAEYLAAAQQAETSQDNNSPPIMDGNIAARLAPRSQSVAAVAEEEWEKRGIGFRSIAEQGGSTMMRQQYDSMEESSGGLPVGAATGGAVILSNYLRQSLIYDQYERTVREQDDALRSRVEKVRKERMNDKK